MRSLARTSLGLLGLALAAPSGVLAQNAPSYPPSGYQVASPAATAPASTGLDGRSVTTVAPEPPHKHKGRTLCAKCAAKLKQAGPGDMPPGRIVGCEHSKNGVCAPCQAALNLPGTFVTASAPVVASASAPGRAVASSNPSAYAAQGYDAGMAEPAPVGVVQANFSQAGPMGMPAASVAPQANAPGRALAESNAGRDPFQAKSGPFPHPHILGHLFGWSGMGKEKAEARAQKKAEAHAMISYDENGTAPVEDLPASMVFGKKGR
jgi:hypothetical protein